MTIVEIQNDRYNRLRDNLSQAYTELLAASFSFGTFGPITPIRLRALRDEAELVQIRITAILGQIDNS